MNSLRETPMPKSKKYTEEEIKVISLERSLTDCRKRFNISTPTIKYKVDEKVVYGGYKESHVTEVLDNGRILKVHTKSIKSNYGNPVVVESDNYVCWTDLVPFKDEKGMKALCYTDEIHLNFFQSSIDSLFHYYYHFGIDMNPDYQRGNVWEDKDKLLLLESIFNNVDIGKFVIIQRDFNVAEDVPLYEILDGKQRLTALVEFYESRVQYKGLYFKDMCHEDQHHFEDYCISMARTERPMTQAQKYGYFLKLNVSGKAQDPKHIEYVKKLYKDSI